MITIGKLDIKFDIDLKLWTLGQVYWDQSCVSVGILCFYVGFWW